MYYIIIQGSTGIFYIKTISKPYNLMTVYSLFMDELILLLPIKIEFNRIYFEDTMFLYLQLSISSTVIMHFLNIYFLFHLNIFLLNLDK